MDFADVAELQRAGGRERAGTLLAGVARSVHAGGADLLLLCTNTVHRVADTVAAGVDIPLLHIGDVTAAAVRAAGIGLPGTAFSMEQAFYRDRLEGHGLDVSVPGARDRALLHRVIYDELCRGTVREESRAAYREVIGRLVAAGAQGVVLGCTEIELLVGPADSPVPVFPTTQLRVVAAVDRALA